MPATPTAVPAAAPRSGFRPALLVLGALALLLLNARRHAFLCDDAFISFRYARNLSRGLGLVFNPGLERVEGFTNLLWVLVLAALDRLGLRPEHAAPLLSIVCTLALGLVLARHSRRVIGAGTWLAAVPVLLLALTRSVAVWSTSGLETRAFELLVVAGVFRAMLELEALLAPEPRAVRPWAAVLLAAATLMRLDALVMAGPVLAAAAWLARGREGARAWTVASLATLAGVLMAQTVFRLVYFGELLPNTYYAKVAGRLRWDWGVRYVAAWALEYGVLLWLPLMALAVRARDALARARHVLLAAALVPWFVYVAAIGGDHFEYRVLDGVFPLAFVVLGEGLGVLAARPRGTLLAAGATALLALALTWIPSRAHADFPARYQPGFPGPAGSGVSERERFLDPDRDVLLRLPVLRTYAAAHRALTRELTGHFVAIRQEEHALFLAKARAQGLRLGALVDAGLLPRDARIATDCVGAIPYFSDLLVLDRHGLTDAAVAHRKPAALGLMAHEKSAGPDDAQRFGVELWAEDPVDLVLPVTSPRFLFAMTHPREGAPPVYAAVVSDSEYVLAALPAGHATVAARTPRLTWEPVLDSAFAARYVVQATRALAEQVQRDRNDLVATNSLAFLLLVQGRLLESLALYTRLAEARPADESAWDRIADITHRLGRYEEERAALRQLLDLARARGDAAAGASAYARLQASLAAGGAMP